MNRLSAGFVPGTVLSNIHVSIFNPYNINPMGGRIGAMIISHFTGEGEKASPVAQMVKHLCATQETQV